MAKNTFKKSKELLTKGSRYNFGATVKKRDCQSLNLVAGVALYETWSLINKKKSKGQ